MNNQPAQPPKYKQFTLKEKITAWGITLFVIIRFVFDIYLNLKS